MPEQDVGMMEKLLRYFSEPLSGKVPEGYYNRPGRTPGGTEGYAPEGTFDLPEELRNPSAGLPGANVFRNHGVDPETGELSHEYLKFLINERDLGEAQMEEKNLPRRKGPSVS